MTFAVAPGNGRNFLENTENTIQITAGVTFDFVWKRHEISRKTELDLQQVDLMIKKIEDGIFPQDIKRMGIDELKLLSYDIRDMLISTVSETGGHLASNLGVVELTIALHRVFDTPRDRIIWDVGHQSYVHKLLTGRGGKFGTLRRLNGLSGFPKRSESPYDTFDTGHASNSVSAALGMAAARDLKGEDYAVVSVIGDGALTGGMVYEAMNNAGAMNTGFIVVLNDNEMSISPNQGSMAQHLGKLRSSEQYNNLKKALKRGLKRIPIIGDSIYSGLETLRDAVKYAMVPGVLFEELGFVYLGPIDGHDLNELIGVLSDAKALKKPVLVHCVTKKGKGYYLAEKNPSKFHGIAPFDRETGALKKRSALSSWSEVFGRRLLELALADSSIIAVTAAMRDGTGLDDFGKVLPERLFDVGIAEEHAVTFAAGAAADGLRPVVAIYSTFLQRAYDQIMIDVCMQNLPVVFCIDRAGIVGTDGETHHGIFDISYLMHMPNLTFFAPSDSEQLEEMLKFAVKMDGPCAIRYPRGAAPEKLPVPSEGGEGESFFKARLLRSGTDVTILAVGNMASRCLRSCALLEKAGISAELIDVRVLKPFDSRSFERSAQKTGLVFVVEDNVETGGFGSCVESLFANRDGISVHQIAWPDEFISHGTPEQLEGRYGMDAESIAERIRKEVERTS